MRRLTATILYCTSIFEVGLENHSNLEDLGCGLALLGGILGLLGGSWGLSWVFYGGLTAAWLLYAVQNIILISFWLHCCGQLGGKSSLNWSKIDPKSIETSVQIWITFLMRFLKQHGSNMDHLDAVLGRFLASKSCLSSKDRF